MLPSTPTISYMRTQTSRSLIPNGYDPSSTLRESPVQCSSQIQTRPLRVDPALARVPRAQRDVEAYVDVGWCGARRFCGEETHWSLESGSRKHLALVENRIRNTNRMTIDILILKCPYRVSRLRLGGFSPSFLLYDPCKWIQAGGRKFVRT